MRKSFNTTGLCFSDYHYMVDTDNYLDPISKLIAEQKYFMINRPRKYGKTTILNTLQKKLDHSYCIFSVSFECVNDDSYKNTALFIRRFFELIYENIINGKVKDISDEIQEEIYQFSLATSHFEFQDMMNFFMKLCSQSEKPVILIMDSVDQASRHKVFLDFLGQIKSMYLKRMIRPTFQSVILAGVRDLKSLNVKTYSGGDEFLNSPWDIAEDFPMDLSLSVSGIEGMLSEYEQDYHTGMNIKKMAHDIYDYTSGYPYFVSGICKKMDEKCKVQPMWSEVAFLESVEQLLLEENGLFDLLDRILMDYPTLKQMLYDYVLRERTIVYISGDCGIRIATMFGFIIIKDSLVFISNKIFKARLYNQFLVDKSID